MTENTESQETVKHLEPKNYSLSLGSQIEDLDKEFGKLENLTKNPFAMASLLLGLKDAFEKFNVLLRDLNATLTGMDERIKKLEQAEIPSSTQALSPRDREVYDFVISRDRVCAEEVQEKFSYRGKHAASARLNKLFVIGALNKVHSGKTVYFTVKKDSQAPV